MSICSNNNEKVIYINSDFRSSGTISEYTIQLDNGIKNVEWIELIDTTCEYSDVIYRNGGMMFTLTRYSVNSDSELIETSRLEKTIHPYVHNNAQAITDFNNMFNNISLAIAAPKAIYDDYNYVTLTINSDIIESDDIVVLQDHNNFLLNYLNIPYKQIIIAKTNKIINGNNVNIMTFVKNITSMTPIPYNYVHYINNNPNNLQLVSKEAFLYTNYTNPAIPNADQQYSEPLHNKSIGVFLETINGINIDIVNTNGGIFNNCFYIHDNTSQRIRNISTAAMSIMGISSVARELQHVKFYFNNPININGFKVRLVYSDGTPYVVNEMNQVGKTTITLKIHCKE